MKDYNTKERRAFIKDFYEQTSGKGYRSKAFNVAGVMILTAVLIQLLWKIY